MHMKKEGYQFVGWFVDRACTKQINPAAELPTITNIYPKWAPAWYPIEYEMNGGMNSRLNPRFTSCESPAYILYPPKKKDQVFAGWTCNGKPTDIVPANPNGPVTIEAHFVDPCMVSFETFGGRFIDPILVGQDGFLPHLPQAKRYGYTFEGWYWDEQFLFPFSINQRINAACTLYAKMEREAYPITYDTQGGISARSNPDHYYFDDPTLLVKPAQKKGYVFDGWYDQLNRKRDFIRHNSMGPLHLKARFHRVDS